MNVKIIIVLMVLAVLVPFSVRAADTPVEEKVAILITAWGLTDGYNFDYAWNLSMNSIGDKTLYPGQPCKAEFHLGPFPFQSHMNIQPFAVLHKVTGLETVFDGYGIYKFVDGVFESIHPDGDPVLPGDIPPGIPVIPLVEVTDSSGELTYPPDPNTGEDHVAGWFKIGQGSPSSMSFPNGLHDFREEYPARFIRYFGITGGPTDPAEAAMLPPEILESEEKTKELLEHAFGDQIDVRFGYYGETTGYTRNMADVAEEFGSEGFTKMILARETTDNNNFANEIATGNYCKERLCEIGVLNDMMIYHTRQVGRTPEFNAMNVMNMRPFIEAYPKGSTIGILYVTRGLPWATESTTPSPFGRYHPWSKEVYHENAYLNYLSFKEAFIKAFGDDYNLVFNRGGADSDLREDNFYSYSMDWNEPFNNTREAIQMAKAEGLDTLIVIPAHWQYDNNDTYLQTRLRNGLPLNPRSDLQNDIFHLVYCEDVAGNEVDCDSPDAVAEITLAPSYSALAEEFAVSYYVALRGTLERFGLFPKTANISIEASQMVTKLAGGSVEVTDPDSKIAGARIEIPADPYPDRPQLFTPSTAIPINDPADTNDCLWEDTVINIGYHKNAKGIQGVKPLGKAVHIGPYRTKFNRDVTITLPYTKEPVDPDNVSAYIFNELTQAWDSIEPESINTVDRLVTIKVQVSGLFQVGEKM
jgi:hypothetical protein